MGLRGGHGPAVIRFAKAHPTAGGAKNDWKIFRGLPSRLMPCFVSGEEQKLRGPIQPREGPEGESRDRQCFRQVNLRREAGALAGDIKQRDGSKGRPAGAKSVGI